MTKWQVLINNLVHVAETRANTPAPVKEKPDYLKVEAIPTNKEVIAHLKQILVLLKARPRSSSEISQRLQINRDMALHRLNKLAHDGHIVQVKHVGSKPSEWRLS